MTEEVVITAQALNILVEEVLVHCSLSIEPMQTAISLLSDWDTRQQRDIWRYVHSFLAHAAMVSKLFEPPRKSPVSVARASALKVALSIGPTSPILGRDARNNVEHLDERLDAWIEAGCGTLLECVFQNRAGLEFLTEERPLQPTRPFIRRVIIFDELVLVTQGRDGLHELPLGPLFEEVKELTNRALTFLGRDASITRTIPGVGNIPIR